MSNGIRWRLTVGLGTCGLILTTMGCARSQSQAQPNPRDLADLGNAWSNWNEDRFKKLLKAVDTDAASIAGAIGGVGRVAVDNGHGGIDYIWKSVEAIDGAHDVDITTLTAPRVVAVLRGTRGKGKADDKTKIEKGATAFIVVYPDTYTETVNPPVAPVVDAKTDSTSFFRVVLLDKNDRLVSISSPIGALQPCVLSVDADGKNKKLYEKKDYSYAKFETCPGAKVSPETMAHFLDLTLAKADTVLGSLSGAERDALSDLLLRAQQARDAWLRANPSSTMAAMAPLELRAWADAGVWFSCGLGCCYANTLAH